MARKRKRAAMAMEAPGMPSAKDRRKWSAESMAHTMMETDKDHKKMVDHITSAVMAAGEKAMHKKGMK